MKVFDMDKWEADMDAAHRRELAEAWEEGRCAAARGQKNNPYIDTPGKDGEDD